MQVRPIAEPIYANLSNIAIVLVNPIYSENIGSTARACANFGIEHLILINPESIEEEKMKAMATKAGIPILEKMKIYKDLQSALKEFNYVIGTTARLGKHRLVYYTPKEITSYICELSIKNKIAILFGNERLGLSNKELSYCDSVITIPTTKNASLNISQAVVIILYEIFQSCSIPRIPKPQLATQEELNIMYTIIEKTLETIDYIPHNNKTLWFTNIKRLLSKVELTSKEVKIIQGFCRQLLWSLGKKITLSFPEQPSPQNDKSVETYQKDKSS